MMLLCVRPSSHTNVLCLSSQDKNSFFVATNVIVTKNQKQGKCPEVLSPSSVAWF